MLLAMPMSSSALSKRADGVVVLDHAVDVFAVAVLVPAAMLGADVRPQVHARAVEPAEERLAGRLLPLHVVDGRGRRLVVDRLHPLLGQRAGVLDRLLADLAEARVFGRIVHVGRLAFQHAARAELGEVRGVLRIVGQFRLFLGVEVVEVAEELVEAVDGGQRRVAVADVVLAELAGGVAEALQQAADRADRAGSCPSARRGSRLCVSPVRMTCWPVRNAERPAVQLCSP